MKRNFSFLTLAERENAQHVNNLYICLYVYEEYVQMRESWGYDRKWSGSQKNVKGLFHSCKKEHGNRTAV